MSTSFNNSFFNKVRLEFQEFLIIKEKGINEQTKERYLNDFDYYLSNYILEKVMIDDFYNIFNNLKLRDYFSKRKGSTARATITNLVDFFYNNLKLTPEQYLSIKKELRKYSKESNEKIDFLTKTDINFIFSSSVDYRFIDRDKEAKVIAPVIWSLAYHQVFEQTHILKLKITDLRLNEGLIRNLRSDEDGIILKWMNLDERCKEILQEYLNYRNSLKIKSDKLLIIEGKEATNGTINKMLNILNGRVENCNRISTNVHVQKFNRSRIYHALIDTNGHSAIDYIHLLGLKKNTQFDNALKQYLTDINTNNL
ncbi:hypothetical protein [Paenibacillus durus]|uniref:Uncharacterized protein n=1 Tax=Paenibacillus durus TaxID=44251 RepID=A0A089HXD0_PAEDU|nr:hypothetical protein [Paenibacillus durus]AIQ15018.1 hypothetical protein PDUR_26445 [Paenibacillus durus]